MRIHPAALALLAAVLAACSPAPRTASLAPAVPLVCTPWCTDAVAEGIVWRRGTLTIPDSTAQTVLVNVLEVDLSNPAVRVRPVRLEDSTYHTVSDMGASTAQAIAGVNGGFFLNGQSNTL